MRRPAALTVGLILAVAGCGGSSSAGGKPRYVVRANTICRAAQAETAPLVTRVTAAAGSAVTGDRAARQRLAADLQQLHTIAGRYLAQLRQLRPPAGDQAAIRGFLTPLGEIVDAVGAAGSAVAADQMPQALALLQRAAPVAQEASDRAQAYGVGQCASVLPPLG